MCDTRYGIRDTGYGIRDTGCAIRDTGYAMRDTRYVIYIGRSRISYPASLNRLYLLLSH